MSHKVNIEEKLAEINKSSKYKYTLVEEYKSNKHKCIEAYCPEHNYKWLTRYNTITTGAKCYYCGIDKNKNSRKLDISTIQNNFDFNIEVEGEYINAQTRNIKCTCKKCGHTWKNNVRKLKYSGCSKCRKANRDAERMDKKIDFLKNKFPNLDFSEYKVDGFKSKFIAKCPIHGTVYKKSYSILTCHFNEVNVCEKCELEKKEKIYLEKLKVINPELKVDFKDGFKNTSTRNLRYVCPKGHVSVTTYHKYIEKPVCSRCHKSKQEMEIVEFIKTIYDKDIIENTRRIIKNEYSDCYLELDIYLPDINLAIEFNGRYWHTDTFITKSRTGFTSAKEYHDYKTLKCEEKGIKLIHIDDIEYTENKELILESIKCTILEKLKQ